MVLKENPELKFGEVGKELGKRWKEMTADQKTPYEKLAAKDKERYAEEKGASTAVSGDAAEEDEE